MVFDPIPTAFGNVQGALKRPIKILGQRVQEGVEVENGPYPPNFKPPFLGKKFRDFS